MPRKRTDLKREKLAQQLLSRKMYQKISGKGYSGVIEAYIKPSNDCVSIPYTENASDAMHTIVDLRVVSRSTITIR